MAILLLLNYWLLMHSGEGRVNVFSVSYVCTDKHSRLQWIAPRPHDHTEGPG